MAAAAPFMDLLGKMGDMSLGAATRGQLSSYQNNGPLNGLVHVLVADIDKLPAGGSKVTRAKQDLLNAFAAEHNIYLTWDDFKQVVKDLNPIQREVVLGPVLRRLIPEDADITKPRKTTLNPPPIGWAAISAEEAAQLAWRFDIKTEDYLTPDAFKAKLTREMKAADINDIYARREPIEILGLERARLAAGTPGAAIAALTPAQTVALRTRISQELSAQGHAMNLQQRVEVEFRRRQALPVGHADHPDTNQIQQAALAAPIATLKLWQSEEDQYQFDIANLLAHNSHYASHSFASYEKRSADVTKVINDAVLKRTAAKPIEIKKAFQQFETAEAKKPGAFAEKMQDQMQGMLSGITNMLGFGDKNGPMAFIGSIFSNLLKGMMPMLGMLGNMKQMVANMGKTPDASLISDPDEMKKLQEENPELAAETREFASLVEKLEELGEKEEAGRLNEAWRATPNTPVVWRDLVVTMIDHGLNDDVDSWMREKSKKTLEHLIREEQKIERSQNLRRPTQLHQELTHVQTAFAQLEDPRLAQASEAYKNENLGLRMQMFEQLMQVATNVMATEGERKKAAADLAQLRQSEGNLRASDTAAAGQPVATALHERWTAVQAALQAGSPIPARASAADQAAIQAKTDAVAGTGLPVIVPMFTAKQGRLQAELRRIHQAEQAAARAQQQQIRRH